MIQQTNYEERIIAFIDILGFREHINKTIIDPEYFIKIKDALDFIETYSKNDDTIHNLDGKEITIFSDSIVISYPFHALLDAYPLLLEVADIQLTMMEKGILMRGGITYGKLVHQGKVVFGPAMIEAYELETTAAIYPRVVVDEKIFMMTQDNGTHTASEQNDYVHSMLHRDQDGQLYVDFLNQHDQVDDFERYISAMFTLKEVINVELSAFPKSSVKMKYEWIKNRFNVIVEEIISFPELIIE